MSAIECYCDDYDPPAFYSKSFHMARKPHRCDECGGPISPGERYRYISGLWDGYFQIFKDCERCCDLQTWVQNNVPCFCPMHGNMDEQMRDAVQDATERAPAETVGLNFGFLRRVVARAKHNKGAKELHNATRA